MQNEHLIFDKQGQLYFIEDYLDTQQANNAFQTLEQQLNWQEEYLTLFGKTQLSPRLVAWYGDDNANYSYSGRQLIAQPWHPLLNTLKQHIETDTQHTFNSVLANYYRHGKDSVGWHADDEPELGKQPSIASLSLGATRTFKIRNNSTKETLKLDLPSGSLLMMTGEFQQHWQHCISKTQRACRPRINLTFRKIHL